MFIPSGETNNVVVGAETFTDLLSKYSGITIKADIATSYSAAIEAIGAKNIEMVIMPPTAYILAADKYDAEILLTVVRNGKPYYRGFILYNKQMADNMRLKINSFYDLKGQRFLFTDPNSTSGYIFPMLLFRSNGIKPKDFFSKLMFSGGHPQSINSVYLASDPDKDFLACVTYEDARDSVVKQYPDVYEKLRIADYTPKIPNDAVCIRKNINNEIDESLTKGKHIKQILKKALIKMTNSNDGREILLSVSGIEGFVFGRDCWYDIVRTSNDALNINN